MLAAEFSTVEIIVNLAIFVVMLTGGVVAGLGIAMLVYGPLWGTAPGDPAGPRGNESFRKDARLLLIVGASVVAITNVVLWSIYLIDPWR